MKNYKQCEMQSPAGRTVIISWLNEDIAKVGTLVEVVDYNEIFKIVDVYNTTLTEREVKWAASQAGNITKASNI